jgi:hypothetical protein
LLSVPFKENTSYPVFWQFDKNGVVTLFADTMALLDTSSSIGLFRFFQTRDEDLSYTTN